MIKYNIYQRHKIKSECVIFFLRKIFEELFLFSLFRLSLWKNTEYNFGILVWGFHLCTFFYTGKLKKNCFLSKTCFQNDYCLLFFFLVTLFDFLFSPLKQWEQSKVASRGDNTGFGHHVLEEKHQEGANGNSHQSLLGRTIIRVAWRKMGDGNNFRKVILSVWAGVSVPLKK